MPRKRKGRALDGVVILDKPGGMTSNAALQKVRWLYNAQKAGHTGALDPLATGVLPICLGEATKFSQYLLDADKGYFTTAKLGDTRNTGDSDGENVKTCPVPEIIPAELAQILSRFRGDINQVPSMYSALKHQGRPLYEWARKGVVIDRPARPVSIHQLELTGQRSDELDLTVECSKGTYIRSLVEDIGNALGCGAHVCMLRRFKAGHFTLEQSVTVDVLEQLAQKDAREDEVREIDQFILPIDVLLPNFPQLCVNNAFSRSLLHGNAVRIADFEKSGLSRLYVQQRDKNELTFAGMVDVQEDEGGWIVQPKRLVNIDPETLAQD